MELQVYQFDLALRYPFTISRHTYDSIQSFIIELIYENISGFGEATTNPYYQVTTDNLLDAFSDIRELLETYPFKTPEQLWEYVSPHLDNNYFALSAIDCAAHDLYGKLRGQSFSYQYGINYSKYPFTSYTLGISTLNEIKKKLKELSWPIYKVKLGSKNDIDIIKHVRTFTNAIIRVDANCAWSLNEAIEKVEKMQKLDVEFIEQPLKTDLWEEMKILRKNSQIPMIADESCAREEDVDKCFGYFDGVNVKLAKCGGLTPALRMIEKARRSGMKVMIGCMTESTVGITAAAQLLPLVDYADLDGPLLLKEDVATGVKYKNGHLKLKNRYGLGFDFKYEKFKVDMINQ